MPIPGLAAYGEDQLSDDSTSSPRIQSAKASVSGRTIADDNKLNMRPSGSSDHLVRASNSSALNKPAIIIRRHPPIKPHPRARLPEDGNDDAGPSASPALAHSLTEDTAETPSPGPTSDELTRIRTLLRPPPTPGVQDWGIPQEPVGPCDEGIEAKITSFLSLKRDPQKPRHFNDSLMANRAFRNPHMYAKLVEFVDVDERTTNFPKDMWDPMDVKEEWYADRIAEAQKARSEATSAAQNSSKRSRIDFTGSSSFSQPKQGRHQPYSVSSRGGGRGKAEGMLGGGYGKGRDRHRWGTDA